MIRLIDERVMEKLIQPFLLPKQPGPLGLKPENNRFCHFGVRLASLYAWVIAMKISLCLLASFVLPLVLLFTSCKDAKQEGPYGFKEGQEYEYQAPIISVGFDGKETPSGRYKTFRHLVLRVGPDWVEFKILDKGETRRFSKEQLSELLPRYTLKSGG